MKTPRPHQSNAVAMLRASVARGALRPMLELATGAGKTFIATMIIRGALEKNPAARILFVVDATILIDQTVKAFYAEGLHSIGVIQADHPMTDASKPLQVASVQTLQRRKMPPADLVIIDEAHRQHAWLLDIMASEEWAKVPFIGLSATPWSKGLGNHFDALIKPISMQELIDLGFLAPFRVFAPAHPELDDIAVSKGDYATGQLSERMQDGELIADLVSTWQKLGEDRPTLVFCVDRAHARKVQDRFNMAGIGAGYIDAYTEPHERRRIHEQLERGDIRVVCNVACLTTGVDWEVGCIVLARPTKSEILYVQMVGRGLRVNEGMHDCIILDHADNALRLGMVTDIEHHELCTAKKGDRKKSEKPLRMPKECGAKDCNYVKPAGVRECPSCGFVPSRQSEIEEVEGVLVEMKRPKSASKAEKHDFHAQLNTIRDETHRKSGWVANTYRKRFGVWPAGFPLHTRKTPTAETRRFVKHCIIAYVKATAA